MDFGMPTLLELSTIEENVQTCSDLGLSFIEINMNLPQYQLHCLDIAKIEQLKNQNNLYFTIHLDERLDPCDFNPLLSDAYLQTALNTIALAKALDIPVLNMHLARGIYFTLPDKKPYLYDRFLNHYLSDLRRFRDACAVAIDTAPIKICVENASGYDIPFLQQGLALLLESPVFALTYDVGHNAVIAFDDEALILSYSDRLQHMHLHDAANGRPHLSLGDGVLDLPRLTSLAATHRCRVVLETKTVDALRASVNYCRSMKLL